MRILTTLVIAALLGGTWIGAGAGGGANATAPPDPDGARGYSVAPAPEGGTATRTARLLLFPARAAVHVGTWPIRTAATIISPSGLLQRMAHGYQQGRYFVPVFGIDPVPDWNAGLRAAHGSFFDRAGLITYRAAYGGSREQLYALTFRSRDDELIPYRPGWSYRLTAKWEVLPNKHYFGMGNLSHRFDLTYYTRERYLFLGSLRYAQTSWMRWDLTLAVQRSMISPGSYLEPGEKSIERGFPSESSAPGLYINPENIQAEVALVLDRRDERGRPHAGWRGEGFFCFARGTGPDNLDFVRYGGELQGYLPIAARHTLALNVAGEEARTGETDPETGLTREIKLTELPSLGGPSTLRGYLRDRFIDNAAIHWNAEYRYRLSRLIEVAAFADFGKVMPRLLDFDFDYVHRSFGAGLRFSAREQAYFRLQLARSDEDIIFVATLEPIFARVDRRERR